MLNKIKTMKGYKLQNFDGEIGKVKEFFFDDNHWTIRYLVADTGNWLMENHVLISPHAIVAVNNIKKYIEINLSKKEIADSPSLNNNLPVSRQFEEDYYGYYGWPAYWEGSNVWGSYPVIVQEREKLEKHKEYSRLSKAWDNHLRSTHDVTGHHIQANDGEIGHVDDFIIDDETWTIRYLIIDTHNWLPAKKVLVSPKWISSVSWIKSKVFINLPCDAIKSAPEYTPETLVTRDYEIDLHQHYNRLGFWVDES